MAYSPLTDKIIPAHASNYSVGRSGQKVIKITPHHVAGNLSIETIGALFQNPTRAASSNYGIGSDGRIGGYVDEDNRAWTSSSATNDRQAITIEVANDGGADTSWHVSDKAIDALVSLCVDICRRHNIKSLVYDGTPNGTVTRHNMFAATACPGGYLQSRLPYITDEINKQLAPPPPKPEPPAGGTYTVKKGDNLSKIAKKFDTTWQILYELNKDVIGSDPNIIYAGQVLRLPDNSGTPEKPQPEMTLLEVVRRTMRGEYGNLPERKAAIEELGFDYAEVQRQVNINAKYGNWNWDSIKLY